MNWLRKFWSGGQRVVVPEEPAPDPPNPPSTEPVAIISDVHANLQALQAVLADIEAQNISQRVCLGDIVGYGGNPAECVDLVRSWGFRCVRGNHDAYAAGNTPLPNRAEPFPTVCRWTRAQLGDERCNWLGNLPFTLNAGGYEAVHTSLNHPEQWRYALMYDAAHFSHQVKPVCFAGHTHQPKMWVEGVDREVDGFGIETLRLDRRQLVNVGSVGQPRDENPCACYVVFRPDKREVWWRRVAYDIQGAQRAIAAAGMPWKYAARLEAGE